LVRRRELTVFVVTVAVIVYFSFANANFYDVPNIVTMVQYIAPIAVVGAGEVLLLVLAEIDLSAGQIFLTAPWVVYFAQHDGIPIGWAIVLALVFSVVVGVINGAFTVLLGVPSLIVTLGTSYALSGLVLVASSAEQFDMPGQTGEFGQLFGIGNWSEITWALGIVAILWVLLKKSRFGVHITASGGNLFGAAESGVRVGRVKIRCFMILALVAGFIRILDTIRIGSLDPSAPGLEVTLGAIVAAVIGGTALSGGRGTVLGTVIGAVFLGVLEDGFNLIGVNADWFIFAEGAAILVAMAVNVQLGKVATRVRR